MTRRLHGQRGQGILEFAVIFPLIVFFLMAIFDVGLGLNRQATLQHAVREGARYGAVTDDIDVVEQRTSDASRGLIPKADVVVCYEDIDGDGVGPGDAVNVSVSYLFHPNALSPVLRLVGVGPADDLHDGIPIDVKGSSRLERTLADPGSAPVC